MGDTAQWIKVLASQPVDLSPIPGTCLKVEENRPTHVPWHYSHIHHV